MVFGSSVQLFDLDPRSWRTCHASQIQLPPGSSLRGAVGCSGLCCCLLDSENHMRCYQQYSAILVCDRLMTSNSDLKCINLWFIMNLIATQPSNETLEWCLTARWSCKKWIAFIFLFIAKVILTPELGARKIYDMCAIYALQIYNWFRFHDHKTPPNSSRWMFPPKMGGFQLWMDGASAIG